MKKSLNILLVSRTFNQPITGGVANSLRYLAKELNVMGHNTVILSENVDGKLKSPDTIDDIRVIRHPQYFRLFRMREDPIYLYRLNSFIKNLLQTERIDAIICRHLTYAFILRSVKTPVVYYMPSFFGIESREFMKNRNTGMVKKLYLFIQSLAQDIMERKVVRQLSNIVVLSRMRRLEIIDRYKLKANDAEKIKIVQPGVDKDIFSPKVDDELDLNKYGLKQTDRIAVTVCRQEYRKNLDGLINEFVQVVRTVPDARLVLIGEGNQHEFLKRLVDKLDLNNHIKLIGRQNDIVSWYSVADVFVLPSIQEGFGQVFLEAMSCGTPCIAFRPGKPLPKLPTDEFIYDGVNGALADYLLPGDLGQKIIEMLSDKARSKQLGKRAREVIESEFSWQKTAEGLMDILKN